MDKYEEFIPIHPKRKHVFEIFKNLLEKYTDQDDAIKKALNIERGIFNYTIDSNICKMKESWNDLFCSHYISRAVTLYRNLNPENSLKNTLLIKKLLNNEYDEFQLCKLTPEEMFPDRAAELQHLYKTEIEIFGLDKNIEDGILKCGKCKSYKTTYYEMQTRSADEPTSKFCTCHNCGHKWRFC